MTDIRDWFNDIESYFTDDEDENKIICKYCGQEYSKSQPAYRWKQREVNILKDKLTQAQKDNDTLKKKHKEYIGFIKEIHKEEIEELNEEHNKQIQKFKEERQSLYNMVCRFGFGN